MGKISMRLISFYMETFALVWLAALIIAAVVLILSVAGQSSIMLFLIPLAVVGFGYAFMQGLFAELEQEAQDLNFLSGSRYEDEFRPLRIVG